MDNDTNNTASMDNNINTAGNHSSGSGCDALDDRKWWVFLATSVVLYLSFLLSSMVYCFIIKLYSHLTSRSKFKFPFEATPVKWIRIGARQLTSGDTIPSKILLVLAAISNIAFIILAIYRSYEPVERCFTLSSTPDVILELILSLFLSFFFLVRFVAAEDKIWFWFKLYTIVDILTLPDVFVAIHLGQDWLGLKCLRFICLTQITDIVRFIPFIKSQDTIDIVSLLVRFGALWMTSAGIVHLIEATGDPWNDYDNAQSPSFLEYAYFIMVTMSTVGYGDLFAMSDIGRAFVTFFIIGGLAFFAIALPALVDITVIYYHKTQYAKFDTARVPKHVIVCGHITPSSVEEFLNDFLHPDRGDTFTHVLFLHPMFPDQALRSVLRSYYTRVQYITGSVLNSKDLSRAKINSAAACFIIANKRCENPIEEDNANLLRLVSIKNTTTDVPVIIQVLRGSSKEQIGNIPGWQPDKDIAICLNELKLGLLAQSCVCPGLSTLIANLFYTSDFPKLRLKQNGTSAWQDLYIKGASNEIYPAKFSRSFIGMKFHDAVRECYQKLGLVLVAVEDRDTEKCYINPSPAAHPSLFIHTHMDGYFIGQDLDHVRLVSQYCSTCHHNIIQEIAKQKFHIRKCLCSKETRHGEFFPLENGLRGFIGSTRESETPLHLENTSGLHCCPPQSLDSAVLTSEVELSGHIVLCIFANDSSPIMGLLNFVRPLRTMTIPEALMKPIVIITDRQFLEKEWQTINTFPQVYLVPGSPLDWNKMEEANVRECHVCVILTALANSTGHEQAVDDKEAVLCCLGVQNHLSGQVRIITDLIQESNVQFLDISDEDDADARVYMAQPFACGEAFATSMFDSVTTAAFHSPGTLYLVENLIRSSARGTLKRCSTHCQVMNIPLDSDHYQSFNAMTFGQLYFSLLDQQCICLAINRELHPGSPKKYVITNPPHDMELHPTDTAFVLIEWTDLSVVQFC